MAFIQSIFNKNPMNSMTAWGVTLWVGATAVVNSLCGADLMSPSLCGTIVSWLEGIGQVLTVLGLRRAAN